MRAQFAQKPVVPIAPVIAVEEQANQDTDLAEQKFTVSLTKTSNQLTDMLQSLYSSVKRITQKTIQNISEYCSRGIRAMKDAIQKMRVIAEGIVDAMNLGRIEHFRVYFRSVFEGVTRNRLSKSVIGVYRLQRESETTNVRFDADTDVDINDLKGIVKIADAEWRRMLSLLKKVRSKNVKKGMNSDNLGKLVGFCDRYSMQIGDMIDLIQKDFGDLKRVKELILRAKETSKNWKGTMDTWVPSLKQEYGIVDK